MITRNIIPTEQLPPLQYSERLRNEDRRMLRETFLRLSQLVHVMEGQHVEDALLLLTTCRNAKYTLNALYAEARKWASEGGHFTGFGDALDMLRATLAGGVALRIASQRAAAVLRSAAAYLSEFEKKHNLYYTRFEDVRARILAAAKTIRDDIAREAFIADFCEIGSGPDPDDRLTPPTATHDNILERLLLWYALARPLTGLARTFITEPVGLGGQHDKRYADYLQEVELGKRGLRSFGFHSSVAPVEIEGAVSPETLSAFLRYAEDAYLTCHKFLVEMLTGKQSLHERFPLQIGTSKTVNVRGKTFRREDDAFVLITDMRNSTGARHVAPELKVKIDQLINTLKQELHARSQTTYDDCRVVACDSLPNAIACAARLFSAMDVHKEPGQFGGLRMGLSHGEMLFADENWADIQQAAPSDNSHNTIARAARLMGLDGARWEQSPLGETVQSHLADWTSDDSLIFFDESIFNRLPAAAATECREIDVVKFKGVGPHRCFGARINKIAEHF